MPYGDTPVVGYLGTLRGIRQAIGGVAQTCLVVAPAFAMISFFMLFLFRLILRKDWVAAIVYVLFFSSFSSFGEGNQWILFGTSLVGNIGESDIYGRIASLWTLLANTWS